MRSPIACRLAAPLLVLAGLAATPALCDDAPAVELKLDVKAGDVFYLRQKQNTEQAIKLGEMDMNSTFGTTQTTTYAVTKANDDGTFEVKVTIGDIKGSLENPMLGTIEFDTSSGEDPGADNPMLGPMLKGLTALANQSYEMTMDRRGTVVSVRGMKEIMEQALKGNPVLGDKAVSGMLDDEAMKMQSQTQFAVFPDGPVAVGAKWSRRSTTKGTVPVEVVTDYTLKSADDATAVISWKSTTKSAVDPAGKPGAEIDGTFTVSRKDGLIVRSDNTTHTVMDMDMPGGAAGAMPKTGDAAPKIHMDMTAKATLERVTAADARPAPKKEAPKAPAPGTPKAPDAPKPDTPK